MANVKRYKFQALVTLYAAGDATRTRSWDPRRAGWCCEAGAKDPGAVRFSLPWSAATTTGRSAPGARSVLATLRLAGDDVADYLGIGSHFDLWLGSHVGKGVVTRRLFV